MFKYWGNCVVHFLFILFFYVTLTVCGQLGKWKAGVCPKRRKEKPRVGSLAWGRWTSSGMTELYAGVPVNILTYNIHNPVIVHVYNCNHTNENAAPSEHWCHSLNSCCFLFVCCLYYPFKTDLQLQFFLFFRSSLVGIKSANKFIKGLCD